MITYTDIKRFDNLPFDDYIKLSGYSHSFLKSNVNGVKAYFNVTDNVRMGSLVDSILTEPNRVDFSDQLYPAAKLAAYKINDLFGDVFNESEKQISYTANISFNGLEMETTGRLDFLIPGFAVIDLKVTGAKDINGLIDFMGYGNQLWHYSNLAGVDNAYLLICQVDKKVYKSGHIEFKNPRVHIRQVDVSSLHNEFWANSIINFGTIKTA